MCYERHGFNAGLGIQRSDARDTEVEKGLGRVKGFHRPVEVHEAMGLRHEQDPHLLEVDTRVARHPTAT